MEAAEAAGAGCVGVEDGKPIEGSVRPVCGAETGEFATRVESLGRTTECPAAGCDGLEIGSRSKDLRIELQTSDASLRELLTVSHPTMQPKAGKASATTVYGRRMFVFPPAGLCRY